MTDKRPVLFIFHLENAEDLEDFTLEEKGMMLDAMIAYAKDGTEPEFEDAVMRAVWKIFRRVLKKVQWRLIRRCY